ncbi:DUF2513 domain-containing protein [Candidatus Binatia bacterium]|nr:DUF2513 domain-containing protein [Candidatus Binatia bacterium]
MKRDMDLIREILIAMEERPAEARGETLHVADRSDTEVAYHLRLLVDAGFITAIKASSNAGPAWLPLDLSMKGHDFLDAARDKTRWTKATTLMKEKAGGFALDVLRDLLVGMVRGTISP